VGEGGGGGGCGVYGVFVDDGGKGRSVWGWLDCLTVGWEKGS
jgi:hypothetical protein